MLGSTTGSPGEMEFVGASANYIPVDINNKRYNGWEQPKRKHYLVKRVFEYNDFVQSRIYDTRKSNRFIHLARASESYIPSDINVKNLNRIQQKRRKLSNFSIMTSKFNSRSTPPFHLQLGISPNTIK